MKRSSGVTALIVAGFGAVGAAITAMVVSKKKKEAAAPAPAKPPTSAVLTQYPVPPVPQVPGAPGAPATVPQVVFPTVPAADMQQKVADALASNDPARMRQVAAELRAAGNTTGAQSLEAIATGVATTNAAINAGVAAVQQILTPPGAQPAPAPQAPPPAAPLPSQPVPAPVSFPVPTPSAPAPAGPPVFTIPTIPGVTAEPVQFPVPVSAPLPPPSPVAPPASMWPETDPTRIDTAQRMATMLASRKPYSEDTALVKAFQTQEALSPVDGLYGPGTATRLAQDYGIVPPKPYYWSKDTSKVPAQKAAYQSAMNALAQKDPARASLWQAAGNVYTTTPAPVSIPTPTAAPAPAAAPAIQIPGLPVSFPLPGAPQGILTAAVGWPETDPIRIDVANRMNTMLASRKPYSEDTALVKAFQTQEALSPVDGLYGPGTATRLAQDYGIIPTKPYYWSKTASKVPAQKAEYRAAMNALAIKDPLRAAQWLAAANV